MKIRTGKIFVAALTIFVFYSSQNLSAQIIEISPFVGYQLGGKAILYDADFRIDDAMSYGGRIAVGLSTTTFVEASYLRSDTEGQYFPRVGEISAKVPMSSNYIQLGGLQEIDMGVLSPFVTLTGGLAVFSGKENQLGSKTMFSFTLGGGTKIWISDNIGIRLQANMLMPLVYNGVGIGCGIGTGGSGCGGSVYTRITPFQGEFSGGLVIKINPSR